MVLVTPGQAPIVKLTGEIDLSSVAAVRAAINEARGLADDTIVIDLADVSFFDSSGLGVLVESKDRAEEQGVDLVLRSVSPAVRRILDLAGTADWFRIEP